MISVIGLAVDGTLAQLVEAASKRNVEVQFVDLAQAVSGQWRFDLGNEEAAEMRYGGRTLVLRPDDGYFCRIADLSGDPAFAVQFQRWRALTTAMNAWLEAAPGRVTNRPNRCLHNGSKPLHEAILQKMGFRVPNSVVSCSRSTLLDFVRAGPTVSKTVCGERADCELINESDLRGFEPESGPIHLQRFVPGTDARVHVVGNRVVGQKVRVDGVDYRKENGLRQMQVLTVPAKLLEQLVEATAELGLAFAGWDFKIDAKGDYWCLEANPMPGYLPYDLVCKGAISDELVEYLQG